MHGKGRLVISVTTFGLGVLDAPGAVLSAEECEAMSKVWSRAALAIRQREYGKVTALDCDGDEMLKVGMDYSGIEFGEDGLPLIEEFATLTAPRSKRA